MDRFRVAWKQEGTSAFLRECESFAAYLGDYTETPAKMDRAQGNPNRGRSFTCPSVMAIVIRGIDLFGEARAWSMPFGLLKTMIEVKTEIDGGSIRFQPDVEEASEIQAQLAEAERIGKELLKQRGVL